MIIVGAGLNHWYHLDMNYRGLINMLIFCGCVGQSGGGWAHYVGQEKLRPQTGWQPLAFALDWQRPARHMNSTSYFYNHSSQWRYETVTAEELLSPMADKSRYTGHLIDFNVRAERMGWLPSAPQLGTNPLTIAREAEKAGMNPVDYTVKSLKEGSIRFAAEQPENGKTTRVTCSSGVLTCSVLPVKVMSLCSSTCWGRSTVSRAKTWGSRAA